MRVRIADSQRRLRFLTLPEFKVNAATDRGKLVAKQCFRDWKNQKCERKLDVKIRKKLFSTKLINNFHQKLSKFSASHQMLERVETNQKNLKKNNLL